VGCSTTLSPPHRRRIRQRQGVQAAESAGGGRFGDRTLVIEREGHFL
jgi:hypothetical protein